MRRRSRRGCAGRCAGSRGPPASPRRSGELFLARMRASVCPSSVPVELDQRVVAQLGVLDDAVDHVDPEAVDAAVQPEAQHVVHGLRDVPGCANSGRAAAAGTSAGSTARWPHPRSRRGRREKALDQLFGGEPSGLGSRQTYQSRYGLSRLERDSWNQGCWSELWFGTRSRITRMPRAWASATSRSKSARVPKSRVDVAVVGDVVAEVEHRRRVERREPDGVDAERRRCAVVQVVESAGDARQVADAVAAGVGEAARVDLVHHAMLPPVASRHPFASRSSTPQTSRPGYTNAGPGNADAARRLRAASAARSGAAGRRRRPLWREGAGDPAGDELLHAGGRRRRCTAPAATS